MVNKIAFFNGKGGCGKTTSIYHVAGVLAKRGERTLVIDFDKQRNLSNSMFMYGEPPKCTIYDFMTATGNAPVAVSEAMFKKHGNAKPQYFGVDCMPGDKRLEDEKMLKKIKAEKFGAKLNRLIEEKGYKWVLVDMPPSNKALNDICFSFVADFVIVPFSSDFFSVSGYKDLLATVTKARELNPALNTIGVYLSRYMANCAIDAYIKQQLQSFGNIFIDVQIPLTADIRESVILGRPMPFFRKQDNSSVQAYERLVKEIERRISLMR